MAPNIRFLTGDIEHDYPELYPILREEIPTAEHYIQSHMRMRQEIVVDVSIGGNDFFCYTARSTLGDLSFSSKDLISLLLKK